MTANQINYQKALEERRSHLRQEELTAAGQSIEAGKLAETRRYNDILAGLKQTELGIGQQNADSNSEQAKAATTQAESAAATVDVKQQEANTKALGALTDLGSMLTSFFLGKATSGAKQAVATKVATKVAKTAGASTAAGQAAKAAQRAVVKAAASGAGLGAGKAVTTLAGGGASQAAKLGSGVGLATTASSALFPIIGTVGLAGAITANIAAAQAYMDWYNSLSPEEKKEADRAWKSAHNKQMENRADQSKRIRAKRAESSKQTNLERKFAHH